MIYTTGTKVMIPYVEMIAFINRDHQAWFHRCGSGCSNAFTPKAPLSLAMRGDGLEFIPIKSSRLAELVPSPPVSDETVPF